MIMGMSDQEATSFLERISATAIVNQAIWKCTLAGLPLTHDNVILFVGDFADPSDRLTESLVRQIQRALDEVLAPHMAKANARDIVQ